jgi:hypothetical protein
MKKSNCKIVSIPLSQIEPDPVGDMLTESEAIRPYIDHYCALMGRGDTEKTLGVIAALPLKNRYLSRVVECLAWALADYDDCTVELDMPYMPNLAEIEEQLRLRLWQLRDLIATLEGK